jgi:hypothetical protein
MATQTRTLEEGVVFFFYRPRVGTSEAEPRPPPRSPSSSSGGLEPCRYCEVLLST